MKYLIILHTWWMSTGEFEVIEADGASGAEALVQAVAIKNDRTKPFSNCEYEIIRLQHEDEWIGRKLTWKERLFGRIDS